jgi:UDP-glucose 4-epimerase
MNDRVLVTGGLGMIGSHVCRALVASGRRPVIYDSGSSRNLISDIADRCDVVQGNIDDLPRLMGVAQEYAPKAILHFAARVGPSVEKYPWSSVDTNLLGTIGIFECARLTGIARVVFPSSKMVYGQVAQRHQHPTYEPVPEEHPREPVGLYGKLKRACEDVAAHYAGLYDLDIVAFRFGSSFGPGTVGRSSAIAVMGLIEAAIGNRPYRFERGAEQADDFCYSGEAGNAAVAALDSPAQRGRLRVYNISSGELISLAQIIATLEELYPGWKGTAGPGLDYRNMGTGAYFRMEIEKARNEIGFRPKYDFRSAVLDYAALLK